MKPAAFEYVAARLARGGARRARRGRRGREADRRRSEPRSGAQHAPRPADAPRRPQPRRARRGSTHDNGTVRIGATVRQAALERDARASGIPLVREALPHVGHVVTRNRGTVGGSIAHADGGAEIPLCLVALGGTVVADGPAGRREIPADEFFVTHYLTTLQPGELVVETVWPAARGRRASPSRSSHFAPGDYAQCMVAVARRSTSRRRRRHRPPDRARRRASPAGRRRAGRRARAGGGALAARLVDPPGSIHASPAYLRHLTGVARRAGAEAGMDVELTGQRAPACARPSSRGSCSPTSSATASG